MLALLGQMNNRPVPQLCLRAQLIGADPTLFAIGLLYRCAI